MADKKNISVEEVEDVDLDKISGGSIDNVNYTETEDICEDTKNKIK